jgi:hypothetical protein
MSGAGRRLDGSAIISIAWHGHCSKHVPQPVHVALSTL